MFIVCYGEGQKNWSGSFFAGSLSWCQRYYSAAEGKGNQWSYLAVNPRIRDINLIGMMCPCVPSWHDTCGTCQPLSNWACSAENYYIFVTTNPVRNPRVEVSKGSVGEGICWTSLEARTQSLSPRAYVKVGGENQFYKVVPWHPHVCYGMSIPYADATQTLINF